MACPLLKKCYAISGMQCEGRDFELCLLYNSILLERKRNSHGIEKKLDGIPVQRYLT